jgi:hypothetical protein
MVVRLLESWVPVPHEMRISFPLAVHPSGAPLAIPLGFCLVAALVMGRDFYRHQVRGLDVPLEVLSAFVLERLRRDAEHRLGALKQAVITVPAFFDETWPRPGNRPTWKSSTAASVT